MLGTYLLVLGTYLLVLDTYLLVLGTYLLVLDSYLLVLGTYLIVLGNRKWLWQSWQSRRFWHRGPRFKSCNEQFLKRTYICPGNYWKYVKRGWEWSILKRH